LYSGIAGAADVIIIPEIPYDPTIVMDKLRERRREGRFASIIVIAEGAKPKDGAPSVLGERKPGEMIRFGGWLLSFLSFYLPAHSRLNSKLVDPGAADRLAKEMEGLNHKDSPHYVSGLEVRTSVLGYIQRGGSPSNYDRILGTRLGHMFAFFLKKKLSIVP